MTDGKWAVALTFTDTDLRGGAKVWRRDRRLRRTGWASERNGRDKQEGEERCGHGP